MKHLHQSAIASLAALYVLCGTIYAGPQPPDREVAPVPAEFNWTGFTSAYSEATRVVRPSRDSLWAAPLIKSLLGSAGFDSRVSSTSEFRAHHEVNFTEHNATVALIYKF